jgi:serine/threonine protein kinase
MELCEGSLKDYVEGKLESIPKDSLDEKILIGQVALGLAYIHDKRIIHKDLKLENILLKRYSPRLVLAKIADFGLAKELKPGKSEFSETEHPGTETYMAPELLSAPEDAYPASFASDVYALGITIARIVLKGKHPFSSNEIRRKVFMINGLVPQNLEGLSWDLIDLILKLTDKYPGKRPNMFLVLLHPYFVLTNDRTKRHFVDQFWTSFKELIKEENKTKQTRKIFNNRNFIEWYETLSRDKQDSDEEIEEMTKTLKSFSRVVSRIFLLVIGNINIHCNLNKIK